MLAENSSLFFFFFSSRRRHTRFDCDWSSDVSSSDLEVVVHDVEMDPVGARGEDARHFLAQAGEVGRENRSEEHTSELQSQSNLVCRLLLEKKKQANRIRRSAQSHVPYNHNSRPINTP